MDMNTNFVRAAHTETPSKVKVTGSLGSHLAYGLAVTATFIPLALPGVDPALAFGLYLLAGNVLFAGFLAWGAIDASIRAWRQHGRAPKAGMRPRATPALRP